jgi:hypothetical protein
MEKLQTVTDIFASAGGVLGAEFLGEAESNIEFEQVFDSFMGAPSVPRGSRPVVLSRHNAR